MADNKAPDNRRIDINEGNYNERIEGDYVQGRNNFLNNNFVLFGRSDNSESSAKHLGIRQGLLKQVNSEVEIRINSSLNNRVYIALDAEKNPEQIELPWSSEIKVSTKPKIKLNNTDIVNIFDLEEVAGRLLILGQPGAGKTTMLLKLASELVKRAKNNSECPVPVLFSLSSWKNDNQNIKDWLVDQLKDKYGLRKDIGKKWIKNQQIIPLLDGLDELAAERQEKCIIKINDFLHPTNWTNPVVVCSRIQEYKNSQTLLQLNNSLELFPFTTQQIHQYLQSTNNLQLWNSISRDTNLSQLAKTPLLLNIIVLATEELSIQTWQQFKSSKKRLSYLFDAYISTMLKRPYKDKQPLQSNTERWLSWLSYQLIEENATEFFIEKMQPDWLSNKFQKLVYNVIVWGVIYALIFGLFFGLRSGLTQWQISGVILGLIIGLILGLILGLINRPIFGLENGLISSAIFGEIQPVENLKFSLNEFLIGLVGGLILGLSFGLSFGGLNNGLLYGAIFGLVGGLVRGLINGFYGIELENKTIPNQGIKQSVINTIIISIVTCLLASLLIFVIGQSIIFKFQSTNPKYNLSAILISSLGSGLCAGLLIGISAIKHFVLRVILYKSGYIPWNYAKFLDYCTKRLFLQRVGGSYRFMHDLLRQHFANSYTQRD